MLVSSFGFCVSGFVNNFLEVNFLELESSGKFGFLFLSNCESYGKLSLFLEFKSKNF